MFTDQPADKTNDSVLFRLSTTELLDLYRNRRDRADLVWGQLMARVTSYERILRENDTLVHLLRECKPYLDPKDETDLFSRVTDVLEEYQEQES